MAQRLVKPSDVFRKKQPPPRRGKSKIQIEEGRRRNLANVLPRLIVKVRQAGFEGQIMQARFDREGGNWASLKPSTVKRRGSAHPILQVTGRLLEGAKKAVGNTYTYPDRPKWRGLQRKTGVPYAKYHQRGTKNMQARTFLRNPGKKEMKPADLFLQKLVKRYIKTGKIG